jgi:magnesium transporter
MKVVAISNTGEIKEIRVNRRALMETFSVFNRDLRPVFSLKQVTTVSRRGECIIVNFKSVKLLIGRERILVFNLENQFIRESYIPSLAKKIEAGMQEEGFHAYLAALELALGVVVNDVKNRFNHLERIALAILEELKTSLEDDAFERLLNMKKQMSKLESRAQEIEDLLDEILADDNEMRDLSFEGNEQATVEEIESILENALEEVENISHEIDDMDEHIDDTQGIITLKMANRRNAIIRFDLILSAGMGLLTMLTVVTGAYGMNLTNHMEVDSNAFYWVFGGLLTVFVLSSVGLFVYMKRNKLI